VSCCAVGGRERARLVFLGTPEVAAGVLGVLLDASQAPGCPFQLAAVVSQPGKPRGRGRQGEPAPSPVTALALAWGVPPAAVLTPPTARDPAFLAALRALRPDLCVTAAYGHYLPGTFLETPRLGTLNLHPSLLPRWRGAAPVQRTLQAGDSETGVTLAYTVQKMDSGPVVAVERIPVAPDVTHSQLLGDLFARGAQLLLRELPGVLEGGGAARAREQGEDGVSEAPKVRPEEGTLTWHNSALELHNRVRAFEGWPGTRCVLCVDGEEPQTVKVLSARVGAPARVEDSGVDSQLDVTLVRVVNDALRVTCQDGSVLELTRLQKEGGKPLAAAAFAAGLRGRALRREATEEERTRG